MEQGNNRSAFSESSFSETAGTDFRGGNTQQAGYSDDMMNQSRQEERTVLSRNSAQEQDRTAGRWWLRKRLMGL